MTSGDGMVSKLDTLIKHRDAILIAEIGALIHDLGKLSEKFIYQMSQDSTRKQQLYSHDLILGNNIVFPHPIGNISLTESDIKNLLAIFDTNNDTRATIIKDYINSTYYETISNNVAKKQVDFIKEYYSSDKIVNDFLKNYLNTVKINAMNTTLTLGKLIAEHHVDGSDSSILMQLLKAKHGGADGIDSGIDKGAVLSG